MHHDAQEHDSRKNELTITREVLKRLMFRLVLLTGIFYLANAGMAQETPRDSSPTADKLPETIEATRPLDQAPLSEVGGDGKRLYQTMLRATALIIAQEKAGRSSGTGWLLDKQQKLLVTNYHVIADVEYQVIPDQDVTIYFPEYRDGQLVTAPSYYLADGTTYHGVIIDTDRRRDLAIVQLQSLPADAIALPLASASPSPGERVHSVGNPGASDAAWVYTSGTVRQVYHASARYEGGRVHEFQRVETQSPTNPGDSGGPLISDRGELVAVNQGMRSEGRLMSWFIDVSEVRDFTEKARQLMRASTAEELNERGVHYYQQERYDKALADFSAAIKLDPRLADAHGNQGWTLIQQGDCLTAIAEFDERCA